MSTICGVGQYEAQMKKASVFDKSNKGFIKRPRKRVKIIVLLAIVAVSIVLYVDRRHAGPGVGKKFNVPASGFAATSAAKTLRVATFNIHSGKGKDNRIDLERIASQLQNVDIVGLNEVRGSEWFGESSQACILGEKLKMPWLFVPGEKRWGRRDFGNGALCRLPVESWLRLPLPNKRDHGRRNMLLLRVIHQERPINVLIVHIVNTEEDARQLHSVIDLFLSLKEPAILMGDLNTRVHNPLLRSLLDRPDVQTAVDHRLGEENLIDWIIFRGLVRLNSKIYPVGASDHPALHVELAWPEDNVSGLGGSTRAANSN